MVLQQLVVGRFEVFAFAYVLPTEVVLHPHVGPAFAFFRLRNATFEGVPRAVAVDVGRLGLAPQFAKIEKMLLTSRALAELRALPFGDEVLRRHAEGPNSNGGKGFILRYVRLQLKGHQRAEAKDFNSAGKAPAALSSAQQKTLHGHKGREGFEAVRLQTTDYRPPSVLAS